MRSRVGVMISLDFDNNPAHAPEKKPSADKLGSDLMDAAREKGLSQPLPSQRAISRRRYLTHRWKLMDENTRHSPSGRRQP
jgi:hypothetical protein